jgi:predicted small metal-binding protein
MFIIDCRDMPNEINCTLMISGSAKEVMKISLRHAIEEHGHKDTKELRKQLTALIKPEKNNYKSSERNKK